jgi:hypothetical protein
MYCAVHYICHLNPIKGKGQDVKNSKGKNIGMELLIQQYREKFETEENLNYYSYKDFVKAERKYLKYVLMGSFDAPEFQLN